MDVRIILLCTFTDIPTMKENTKNVSRWRNSFKYRKSIQYYKLANNDESVHIYFKFKGKEYKKCIGHKKRDKITDKKAKRLLEKWRAEVTNSFIDGLSDSTEVTFGELWESYDFFASVHFRSHKKRSLSYYKHLQAHLKEVKASEVNDNKILFLQSYLQDKELKSDTINNIVGIVPAVLNFCVKQGLLDRSHIRNYVKLKSSGEKKRFLTKSQQEELLKSAKEKDEESYRFVFIALELGARTSALLRLRGVDVVGDKVTVWDDKRKAQYSVKMSKRLKEFFKTIPKNNKRVIGETIEGVKYETIYKRVSALLSPFNENLRKGESRVTLHTLRHTFAFNHLTKNPPTPLNVLRDLLNHSTIKTTERYYEHLTESYKDGFV